MNGNYKVIKAPDASRNIFYKLLKRIVIAMNMRKSLTGTKEEVLARAAKMNKKNSYSIIPADGKANYTDHLIGGKYHCVETDTRKTRQERAVLFVFGGGMILGSDKGDVDLCRKIAQITEHDVWFPYYPMCHEHDMLENVEMIFGCYEKNAAVL